MPGGVPVRGKVPPYFFFSYHRSDRSASGKGDPDRWARKLFDDLRDRVYNRTGTSNPAFRDRQVPLASEWPEELADALACCRVFVPVLWPPYFTSEFCGKEWAAFTRRAMMHLGPHRAHAAMVPLLWSPFRLDELPPQVSNLNLIPPGLPQKYEDEGIFGLMTLQRHRATYQDSLNLITKMIIEAAAINLPPCAPINLKSIPSAFAEHLATLDTHQIRVIVAARPVDGDRSPYYYGRTMLEWSPYRNAADPLSIAQHAERIIAALGHHAMIESIDLVTEGIGVGEASLVEGPPAADRPGDSGHPPQRRPVVLLLDPWAAGVPWIRDKLRVIDACQVHIVVPWNDADEQTAEQAARLREDIRAAMPDSLALSGSAPRVPTLEAFRSQLPKAVNEAIATHFRTAPAYPPEEPPSMDKPTLGGPGA
jgi:TIR domain